MTEAALSGSFWEGKTPCWAIRSCAAAARELCEAMRDPSVPCWEQMSLCKKLFGIDTCFHCDVRRGYDVLASQPHRMHTAEPPGVPAPERAAGTAFDPGDDPS